jgi:hypothetical protein
MLGEKSTREVTLMELWWIVLVHPQLSHNEFPMDDGTHTHTHTHTSGCWVHIIPHGSLDLLYLVKLFTSFLVKSSTTIFKGNTSNVPMTQSCIVQLQHEAKLVVYVGRLQVVKELDPTLQLGLREFNSQRKNYIMLAYCFLYFLATRYLIGIKQKGGTYWP